MRTHPSLIATLGLIATLAVPSLASARGPGPRSTYDGPPSARHAPTRFVARSELVAAVKNATWLRPDQAVALAAIETNYEAREARLLAQLADARADLAKASRRSRRGWRGHHRAKAQALAAVQAVEVKLERNAVRAQRAAMEELNPRQQRAAKWAVARVLNAPPTPGTVAVYRGGRWR